MKNYFKNMYKNIHNKHLINNYNSIYNIYKYNA